MKTPNILWITAEHLRADAIGALGAAHARTPNIDRLIGSGTVFTRAFCQSPVCTPSRASFLTGRYPVTTRCRQNGQNIPETEVLFPRRLRDHGYRTCLVGKLHVCSAETGTEPRVSDGYEGFFWSHGATARHGGQWVEDLRRNGLDVDDVYHPSPVIQSRVVSDPAHHQTTWCVSRALEWMDAHAHEPWMISVNPFAVHDPFDVLPEYFAHFDPDRMPLPCRHAGELEAKPPFQKQKSDNGSGFDNLPYRATTDRQRREMVAAYFATLEHLDAEIGRLLDGLESRGCRQDTLVVFAADHGELLGDHGMFSKGPFFYESLIRVPLVFSWPGHILDGMRRDALVELVDIAPTLCDLLEQPIPAAMQGRSLKRLLQDDSVPDSHREGVYCEAYNCHRTPTARPMYATMWRDPRYKIVVHHTAEPGELYDLERDPAEINNLWDDPASRALRERLVLRCFAAAVHTMDPLPPRVGTF